MTAIIEIITVTKKVITIDDMEIMRIIEITSSIRTAQKKRKNMIGEKRRIIHGMSETTIGRVIEIKDVMAAIIKEVTITKG